MAERRFTPDLKARVVLEELTGVKSAVQICREHQLKPQVLSRWKAEFLARAGDLCHERKQERRTGTDRRAGADGRAADHGAGGGKKASNIQKRQVIEMLSQDYPVTLVWDVVGCARSSYYYQAEQPDEIELNGRHRSGSR